jgi:para-nitrobenzyl esterase
MRKAFGWAGLVLTGALVAGAAHGDEVKVTGGTIRGLDQPDGSHLYFTIPYAAPPTGHLRWQPPAPVIPWSGVRDATAMGAPCLQGDEGWNATDAAKSSEDCLYLSVHTPAHAAGDRLPVMVWIHGGSNRAGSGYGTAWSPIAAKGIVVVSIEYRLGVFGFLASPDLTKESARHASGNYALMDQVAALQWVRDNIAAFGGDADKVTVAGQSAGAMDVSMLLRSPLARGLFRRAIQESGAMQPPRSAADNEKVGVAVMDSLHLTSLSQLRAASGADLLKATADMLPPDGKDHGQLWMEASADGYVLTAPANDLVHNGDQASVPLLLGDNSREDVNDGDLAAVRKLIVWGFDTRAADAEKLYGITGDQLPPADPVLGSAGTQVISDIVFRCPDYREAAWQVAAGQPVFRYEFAVPRPGAATVAHSTELGYVFNPAPAGATFGTWPPALDYWANFVKSGDPNGPGLPAWPQMGAADKVMAFLPSGPAVADDYRGPQCRLMMSVP